MADSVTKRISLAGIDQVELLGGNDANLRLLRREFSARITARGEDIVIEGSKDEVEAIARILDNLIISVKKGMTIGEGDMRYAVSMACQNQDSELTSLHNDRVEYRDLRKVIRRDVDRILLVRPAVEAGESLGFLPGDYTEKVGPYLRPLYDALYEMMPAEKIMKRMEMGIIEVAPLAYMRGRTVNNSFVILDEAQNTTLDQMKMFLTRLGFNSKVVITGDITQIDLAHKEESGLVLIQAILKSIEGIRFIYLTDKDVVRHRLVQEIIKAFDKHAPRGRRRR
jgi:phosphate starvation-inducible PhoH-like protein